MNDGRKVLTATLLSVSLGLASQSIFAQNAPSGGSSTPGMPGQTVPEPGPRTQPTIPGQPAPGRPQTDLMPGQPGTPMPGQPGTIPERAQEPRASEGQNMVVSAEHIKKAQEALKAKGLNPGTDGKLDEKTQQALRDFQKVNDLPATGVLDAKTAAKLGITLDSGKSTGSRGVSGSASERASGSAGSSSKSGASSSPSSSKSQE